jgi:hypothetical protein
MVYKIDFDAALGVIHVIYNGRVCLSDRVRAVMDVCNSYSHLKPLKMLINVREMEMDLTHGEQISFGEYLASIPVFLGARVAVLHKSNNNPNFLIDATAFANGYTLAQFHITREALDWLTR